MVLHGHLERRAVLSHGTVVDGLGELRGVVVNVDDADEDLDVVAQRRLTAVRTVEAQLVTCGQFAVCRPVCCHDHVRVDELLDQREMLLSIHTHRSCCILVQPCCLVTELTL